MTRTGWCSTCLKRIATARPIRRCVASRSCCVWLLERTAPWSSACGDLRLNTPDTSSGSVMHWRSFRDPASYQNRCEHKTHTAYIYTLSKPLIKKKKKKTKLWVKNITMICCGPKTIFNQHLNRYASNTWWNNMNIFLNIFLYFYFFIYNLLKCCVSCLIQSKSKILRKIFLSF